MDTEHPGCDEIRLDRKKICILTVLLMLLGGAGMLGPINSSSNAPLVLPVVVVLSLTFGCIFLFVTMTMSFSVTHAGIESFHFGETSVLTWAEIRSVHRAGALYLIRGNSWMRYVMFPSLFWVEDQASLKRCMNEYAPQDSPLRKYYQR